MGGIGHPRGPRRGRPAGRVGYHGARMAEQSRTAIEYERAINCDMEAGWGPVLLSSPPGDEGRARPASSDLRNWLRLNLI